MLRRIVYILVLLSSLPVFQTMAQENLGIIDYAKLHEEEEYKKSIWGKRKVYLTFGYVNQSLSRREVEGGTYRNKFGMVINTGKVYYLHENPLWDRIKFGIDCTYFDINYALYEDKYDIFASNASSGNDSYQDSWYNGSSSDNEENADDFASINQTEFSIQVGPSITVNPFKTCLINLYFHIAPSYSMLVCREDMYHGYGTFFNWGGTFVFKNLFLGVEARWGNTKYNNMTLENFGNMEASSDKVKWHTGSTRFCVGFRF